MRKATFYLETFGENHTFDGYTDGSTWNGWACPLFDFDTAQKIVELVGATQKAGYDKSADEFVFDTADTGEPADFDRFGPTAVPSVGKLYPIGTGAWIWSEVEE